MPRIHKILVGENAALYLPFGLAQLRQMARAQPKGYFSHKFYVEGFEIQVEQKPPDQYVRITAVSDDFYFEFATSGAPIQLSTYTQEDITGQRYDPAVISTKVRMRGGAIDLAPVLRGGKRSADSGLSESLIGRQSQVQLVNEPVAYTSPSETAKRIRYPNALYESWAPGHPHTGPIGTRTPLMLRGYPFVDTPGPVDQWIVRDQGFDVPFEIGSGTSKTRRAYVRGDADWPRASGVQTVKDDTFGTREFAISVDAFNQFSVFPTSQIQAQDGITQNVDSLYVKLAYPTFPDWAFVPSAKFKDTPAVRAEVDQPELDWKFNHLGTKAVSIVYERRPYVLDAAYWAADASATPMTSTIFNEIVKGMGVETYHGVRMSDGYHNDVYFVAPGVLEIAVNILLTGINPEDFAVTLVVREVRTPATMTRWAALVGYVWYDIRDTEVKAGDLVSFDLERWAGEGFPADDPFQRSSSNAWSIRDMNTLVEHKCMAMAPIVAVDMTTLSFVKQAYVRGSGQFAPAPYSLTVRDGGDVVPISDLGGWWYDSYAMAVFHGLKFQDLILRETPYRDGDLDELRNYEKTSDFRTLLTNFTASHPSFQYVPVNLPADGGWSNPGAAGVRNRFARNAGQERYSFYEATGEDRFWRVNVSGSEFDTYKTGDPYDPLWNNPTTEAMRLTMEYGWYGRRLTDADILIGSVADNRHLLLCTAPKWGWHMYSALMAQAMHLEPGTTFYAHPNGSYAFWSNSYVYNGNGLNPDSVNFYNGIFANFDPALVEHIIFDRIHLEVRNKTKLLGARDTTFLELYNSAIRSSIKLGALREGETLREMTKADMRAVFSKDTITDRGNFPGVVMLDLRAEWDGNVWWFPEPVVNDGPNMLHTPPYFTQSGPVGVTQFRLKGLNFGQFWYLGRDYSGGVDIPALGAFHVRFANPIVIQTAGGQNG